MELIVMGAAVAIAAVVLALALDKFQDWAFNVEGELEAGDSAQ